jgi:hypothetical protein
MPLTFQHSSAMRSAPLWRCAIASCRGNMTKKKCVTAAFVIWFTGTATAQSLGPARSFDEVQARVKVGDLVEVMDASGVSVHGDIVALSDVSLTLLLDGTRREFASGSVRQIDRRRRDPVKDGLLMGLGAGVLVGVLAGSAADSSSCPRRGVECGQGALVGGIGGAVWGGLGGWLADVRIRKREIIYLAQGQPGNAQPDTAPAAWARVQQLDPHTVVRVELDDRVMYQGTLRAADAQSVTLTINGHPQPLARAHIHQVSVARSTSRRRRTWIGLGIGAATASVTVGLHCRGRHSSCTEIAPAYFYPLTAAGGAVGALWPAGQRWKVIFARTER